MKNLIFVSFLLSLNVEAAGKGGSVTDLLIPAVNFILLASFIVWKSKKPLTEMFIKKANDVESIFNHAKDKKEKAEKMIADAKTKLSSIEAEKKNIVKQAEDDIRAYENNLNSETDGMIARLESEVGHKVESERKSYLRKIQNSLINKVLSQTKSTISSNKDYKEKATNNLVGRI